MQDQKVRGVFEGLGSNMEVTSKVNIALQSTGNMFKARMFTNGPRLFAKSLSKR